MFNEKDILARLQNGEDAQKIADEIAAMINSANKTFNDQKRAEEEAKKKAEVQKKEELQTILDNFTAWFSKYYNVNVAGKLEADDVLELIASIQGYVDALKGLEAFMPTKKVVHSKDVDAVINDFLKSMNW